MAQQQTQTFAVKCAHCDESFHVRFPLSSRDSGSDAEVVVTCLYCGKDSVVSIPDKYVAEAHLLRGKRISAG